jgi:hypothetical protein
MSQIAVIAVTVVTEAPEFGQGDTEASPQPDPSASRITDNTAVAKTPPWATPGLELFAHHPVSASAATPP